MQILAFLSSQRAFLSTNALAIRAIAGIYAYDLALIDEEGHTDLCAGLQRSGFEGVGSGIALQSRLGVGDLQLHLGRQFGEENSVGGSVGNDIAGHTLFEEIHTGDEVVGDGHLLESLVVHEDVVCSFFVEELVGAALNTYVLELLADIEAALQHAAVHYIFEFNTHNCVTLTRLNVEELNYEIQTAVHADAYAVFDVLTVNHKIIYYLIIYHFFHFSAQNY